MGALLSFSVEGGPAVVQGLVAMTDGMKDLTEFWKTVFAPKYAALVQDLFATGGRARGGGGKFKGGAWAGLSPAYRIWKTKHYQGQPILVREGRLRESLRWNGSTMGSDGFFLPNPAWAVIGTTVPYGKYHQHGTKRMVARPFMPPPDPAVFAPLMKEWLLQQKTKQGISG